MTPKDRMSRAEDYVFGLLDEQERQRAERDMEVDAEFRDCVMLLAEQLRRLREEPKVPLSIPDDAWRDISRRIAAMPHLAGVETAARMAGIALPSNDPSRKGLLRVKRPAAHQFGGWRGTVAACALAAALLVGYFAGQASAPAPTPMAAAVLLAAGDGQAAALIEEYAARRLRILPLTAFDVPEGKVLQVWSGEMPVGIMARAVETILLGPDALPAPQAGRGYAITLEEAPASSTGRPQGPVLASGSSVLPPR